MSELGGGRGRRGGQGRRGGSGRGLTERAKGGRAKGGRTKPGRGRTASSARWLARQHADRYVAEARRRGYRSRAAFKLRQIDDKARFLRRGARVVDLGAAPGGWTQVALERCGSGGRVVAVDTGPLEPLPGAVVLVADVREVGVAARIRAALGGPADVVLSDMAAPATGHAATDHLRVVALAEAALDVAEELLRPGGTFVAKVFMGGAEGDLLARLKRAFARVRHVKPPASRAESAETYVVASGYRGAPPRTDPAAG